jgi:CMP-N-acetylneuraminic acid synthetase
MLEDFTFVIPARRNSKGLPFKNRKLILKTIDSIPHELKNKIVISTDDEFIKENCSTYKIHNRSEQNARDESSIKDVMMEVSKIVDTKNIIMLYTTYPERTYEDISAAVKFFEKNNSSSLLCKKQVKTSPFLMMYEEGMRGKQIIHHNLYRRQDYPICFEISHFISIFSIKELKNLNNNMYNRDTIFFPIADVIDVDYYEDLKKYEN